MKLKRINMTSTMHRFLAIFILTGSFLSFASADYDKYVPLIFDVRNEYRASSVFFVFSGKNPPIEEYTKMHSLSRTLARDGVFTVITHFHDLTEHLDYYRKRVGRPLVVTFIKSLDDMTAFNKSSQTMDKSYPVWLVIFHGNSSQRFCEYCHRPEGNNFGLRLDTLMLVLCCDNSTLHEWWSIHENRTEIDDLGTWTANARLNASVTNKGLNSNRRDVRGKALRVVIVSNSPVDYEHENRFHDLFEAVLRELQRDMNFTIVETRRSDGSGNYNSTTKDWSGAMGMLTRGEVDLAIPVPMTESRLDAIDFSHPLLISPSKLFIKKLDARRMNWFGYFEVFTLKIWVGIIALVILTPLLLSFMIMKGRGSKSFGRLYFENYLIVWGIFCQQSQSQFPPESSMKIAYYSIFVSGIVVFAAYSASLMSFITVSIPTLPFSNLDGFVKDGSYKLIVARRSMYYDSLHSSTTPIYQKMRMAMKPWEFLPANANEAWEQICSERVALITSDVTRKTTDTKCKVMEIQTVGVVSWAIALPAGSQYTEVINYRIERFKANGMINRLKDIYYIKDDPAKTTYDIVEFSKVVPILSILAGGMIFAFVVWVSETIYYTLDGRRHRRCLLTKSRKIKVGRSTDVRKRESSKDSRLRPPLRTREFDTTFIGYYP